ncbi:MAG TPA: AraC family transcriptional regulator [Pseudonocardiaceae bacterium]|nr:AraC family transcriptional regulator [Pseudonocardiaceae bacterium]
MPKEATEAGYRGGVPIYRYRTGPEISPVALMKFGSDAKPGHGKRHIHDFPVVMYLSDGDAYVLAPGAVIDPSGFPGATAGCGVFFDPAALGGDAPWPSWRVHPLLFPFLHGVPGGSLRLHVPPERRPMWAATIASIETELAERGEGYRQAVLAYVTLLLVDVGRLATDVVGDLRRSDEPLLAEVFEVIEQRFAEPLSLRDVAKKVGMTPGHLTTLVRRRTGRTVVDWIIERRMVQARQLLAETDLPVGEIARRVGLPDPGYFARVFGRTNAMTPRQWRQRAA